MTPNTWTESQSVSNVLQKAPRCLFWASCGPRRWICHPSMLVLQVGVFPGGVPSRTLPRNSWLHVSDNWSQNNGKFSHSSAGCVSFGSRHAFFCPFSLFVLFLRGQNPLLYRGIQYFGFPQSCNVAPQDCFFQIQWMDSDAGFYGDYDISIKHDPRPRFNRDMSVQSQVTGS